jgi:hypothetical protein
VAHAWRAAALLLGLLSLLACQEAPPPGPADTVRTFLRLMDESGIRSGPSGEVLADEVALQEAFALLSNRTQSALRERADLAASLAGGEYQAHNILIPGRFRLRFEPVTFDEIIEDERPRRATVRVRGRGPGELAEIPLVEEEGRWRIPLDIPPAAESSF